MSNEKVIKKLGVFSAGSVGDEVVAAAYTLEEALNAAEVVSGEHYTASDLIGWAVTLVSARIASGDSLTVKIPSDNYADRFPHTHEDRGKYEK